MQPRTEASSDLRRIVRPAEWHGPRLRGNTDDPSDAETVTGLGARKNVIFLRLLRERGVSVYPGSLRYLQAVRAAGLLTAVVSSSENGQAVLQAAGIARQVEASIDGSLSTQEHGTARSATDALLAAMRVLNVVPSHAALFEGTPVEVEAARSGGFGWVVGVDRARQRGALLRHGADVVVDDLAELLGVDDVSTLLD
jgi:beta-phosphoglucomutase-like phosphatase (HAD superfamily)